MTRVLKFFLLFFVILAALVDSLMVGVIYESENSQKSLPDYEISLDFNDQLPLSANIQKGIEIDLTKQRLKLWIDDRVIAEYIISSGKKRLQPERDIFSVISKYPVAYGVIEGILWTMPYFLGIYKAGGTENGIHELPLANGYRETVRDMGRPVSHGCVRLGIGDAEEVYNWAELGTPVRIHY